jgi:hypothetical protein
VSEKTRLVEVGPGPFGESSFVIEEVSCSRCFFYNPEGDQDSEVAGGECRRWAPKPYLSCGDAGDAPVCPEWPHVFGNDWCGEFSPNRGQS